MEENRSQIKRGEPQSDNLDQSQDVKFLNKIDITGINKGESFVSKDNTQIDKEKKRESNTNKEELNSQSKNSTIIIKVDNSNQIKAKSQNNEINNFFQDHKKDNSSKNTDNKGTINDKNKNLDNNDDKKNINNEKVKMKNNRYGNTINNEKEKAKNISDEGKINENKRSQNTKIEKDKNQSISNDNKDTLSSKTKTKAKNENDIKNQKNDIAKTNQKNIADNKDEIKTNKSNEKNKNNSNSNKINNENNNTNNKNSSKNNNDTNNANNNMKNNIDNNDKSKMINDNQNINNSNNQNKHMNQNQASPSQHLNSNNSNNKNEENEELNTLIDTYKKEIKQNNNNQRDNNKIEPNDEKKKYSFSRYTKAPKTGLRNLGNTSYLNAVLQLLGNIRNIASYFLHPETKELIYSDIRKYPLSFVFQRLFLHLYPYPEIKERQIYKPDSILLILGALNIVYKSKNQRNPNDLISFILNTIHSELNPIKDDIQSLNPDIYDRKKVIKYGIYNFSKYNNSIISNNLNWVDIKESKCTSCNNSIYNFNTFNVFELDILETFQNKQNNPITINDCLEYYEKPKKTNILCKKCRNKISNISKIFISSINFIFSLNRGDLDKKLINIPFIIEDKIDLTLFIESKDLFKHYELTGLVSITKDKEGKDIYVCFSRSPIDNQWYQYYDEKVQEIQLEKIIKEHNNNQYIPCILCYKHYNSK